MSEQVIQYQNEQALIAGLNQHLESGIGLGFYLKHREELDRLAFMIHAQQQDISEGQHVD